MILSRRKHTDRPERLPWKREYLNYFYLFILGCWVFIAAYGLSLFGELGATLCCDAQALRTQG